MAAKQELDNIVILLNKKYKLDSVAQKELAKLQVWYLERTLTSITKDSKRKHRLERLNSLDFSLYYKYKKPRTWKEWILFILLRIRCFSLYDLLMSSKQT